MNFEPIGVVRSPFTEQAGTPIQPCFSEARGEIVLEPQYESALADLEGFDRIWLVYLFHRARPFEPRVTPYRDAEPRGLFATRAPSRPNPIGISVLRLERVNGRTLAVHGLDILDDTPVLDVKPYVPRFDAFPDSRAGWLDESGSGNQTADDRFEQR